MAGLGKEGWWVVLTIALLQAGSAGVEIDDEAVEFWGYGELW